jgi:glycosyltransferase involved in cell wall biosynthesis
MKVHIKCPSDFKISACTIAKNEENTIAASINSYKKYVDEIIVVDTGSTDDTVKIARDLGARVLQFEWRDDFAAAKNTGIDAAAGDWIICLDADEYFAEDTCENLRTVIQEAYMQNKNAIGCRMENIDSNTGENIADAFSVRVIKSGTRYRYAVHEEIYNPESVKILTVDKSRFYLKHTGYSKSLISMKCQRNLDIMLCQLKTETAEVRKISYCSYISDSYYGIGKYNEAIEYAEKYIEQSKPKNIRIFGCETKPYLNIIESLEALKKNKEDITPYVEKFLSAFPDCPDAYYASGRDCTRRLLFCRALNNFKKALEMSEGYGGTYIDMVAPHKAFVYNYCGICEESLLNTVQAMNWYFKALQETENYQVATFNLLRVVRGMPKKEVDSFVEALYLGKSKERHLAIISALMCNYMVPQLVKCYAAYRSDKKDDDLSADVTAFIMAGEGKYAAAANLFFMNYSSNGNKDIAMRCLLCAALSGDKELTAQGIEICNQVQASAIGLSAGKKEFTTDDVFDISAIYIECTRLGQIDFLTEKMNLFLPNLDNGQLMRLSGFLADGFAFEAALCAARHADISAGSAFMQGYCFYRMHRLNEAVELLLLAKHMGYDRPAFDEIYGNIAAIREKKGNELPTEEIARLKARIDKKLEAGNYGGAGGDIETYMRIAEPDAGILCSYATLLYYGGEYKRAAVAAECGLLKDENNFDLLYNAGCVYQEMGNFERARAMYLKALRNCKDTATADEIRQTLGVNN